MTLALKQKAGVDCNGHRFFAHAHEVAELSQDLLRLHRPCRLHSALELGLLAGALLLDLVLVGAAASDAPGGAPSGLREVGVGSVRRLRLTVAFGLGFGKAPPSCELHWQLLQPSKKLRVGQVEQDGLGSMHLGSDILKQNFLVHMGVLSAPHWQVLQPSKKLPLEQVEQDGFSHVTRAWAQVATKSHLPRGVSRVSAMEAWL